MKQIKIIAMLFMATLILSLQSCSEESEVVPLEITVQDFAQAIAENPDAGQVIGSIEAITSKGVITFSLEGQEPEGALRIDAATGELSVADPSLFDFEERQIITATVTATVDGESQSAKVEVTITDHSIAVEGFSMEVNENPDANQLLGKVEATTNTGELVFSLDSQEPAGALRIDATTGELSVADPSLFDFEERQVITATVTATVDGESQSATIEIEIKDVDESLDGVSFIFTWQTDTDNEECIIPIHYFYNYDYTNRLGRWYSRCASGR